MKRYFLLFFLSLTTLFASKILSYNIYDRSNRVDIMLTFDTPYNGKIFQKSEPNKKILTLFDTSIEAVKEKPVQSPFLEKLQLFPKPDSVQVVLNIKQNANLSISKTVDGYGLRFRVNKASAPSVQPTSPQNQGLSALPTKAETVISNNYYLVLALLFIALVGAYFLKRAVLKKQGASSQGGSWLLNKVQNGTGKSEGINVSFQKMIDTKNRVVLIEYNQQKYLALVGSSNILLDKFNSEEQITQSQFEQILRNNQQELDNYLNIQAPVVEEKQSLATAQYDSLEDYKRKVAAQGLPNNFNESI